MTGFSSVTALETRRGASSLEKMLGLLDLFTATAPAWATDDLIRVSGTSRSTCYRYIKALQAAGLLTPVAGGAWMLGPRIIELDRTMRLCDPVTAGGVPAMRRLAEEVGQTGLLCLLFSGTVMCVADAPAPGAPEGLFSRGQRRPLFTGAASKVILAHLPPHQLRAIFARHRPTIAAAGLGGDWESFRHALRAIREAGHGITQSEFLPGILGVAAPLFNAEGGVLGSIGIAAKLDSVPDSGRAALAERVMAAAKEACAAIADQEQLAALPARAVG
ncbi:MULTISPECIES: IclR family transcriptional regulator [Roseomonadaceae]|uniref:IclR family transcriptional regulator n=1 Tax=Falsiroseomonas oleicola TaxID=2801474 RepID=A0ABS6H262_9PROT|nr:IclR family transcriptional regulator [Roseomonas oleicola]MBU8542750.1 IclR family transcriptional regulator [Roseomonas oleicola]